MAELAFHDAAPVGTTKETSEGYLVADARAGRIGIQLYRGDECGRPDMDVVRVYRPEEEVFRKDTMESMSSLPITLDHPPELVTAHNWKKFAHGFTGEEVARDGGFVRVPLVLKDIAAVRAVKSGKKELSWGYTCQLDFSPGETPDGQTYDAVQRNIRGNHLAVVSKGRAGRDCRIGDSSGDHDMNLKTIMVDGPSGVKVPVEVTDVGATIISEQQKALGQLTVDNVKLVTDHAAALKAKDAEHEAAIKAKDAELGALQAEIEKLKGQAVTGDSLDKLIADRAEVLHSALRIARDGDFKGKTPADIRRTAVAKKLGDKVVKDRSDDYVQALFDKLVEDSGVADADPVRDLMRDGRDTHDLNDAAEAAYAGMVKDMTTAYLTANGKAA
jgi:hypothetical protein